MPPSADVDEGRWGQSLPSPAWGCGHPWQHSSWKSGGDLDVSQPFPGTPSPRDPRVPWRKLELILHEALPDSNSDHPILLEAAVFRWPRGEAWLVPSGNSDSHSNNKQCTVIPKEATPCPCSGPREVLCGSIISALLQEVGAKAVGSFFAWTAALYLTPRFHSTYYIPFSKQQPEYFQFYILYKLGPLLRIPQWLPTGHRLKSQLLAMTPRP